MVEGIANHLWQSTLFAGAAGGIDTGAAAESGADEGIGCGSRRR